MFLQSDFNKKKGYVFWSFLLLSFLGCIHFSYQKLKGNSEESFNQIDLQPVARITVILLLNGLESQKNSNLTRNKAHLLYRIVYQQKYA